MKNFIKNNFKLFSLIIIIYAIILALLIFFFIGLGLYLYLLIIFTLLFLIIGWFRQVLFVNFIWIFIPIYLIVSVGFVITSFVTAPAKSTTQNNQTATQSDCRWNATTSTQKIPGHKTYISSTKLNDKYGIDDIKNTNNNSTNLTFSISAFKNKTAKVDLGTRIEKDNYSEALSNMAFEVQVCDVYNKLAAGSYRSDDASKLTYNSPNSVAIESGLRYNTPIKPGTYRMDVSYFYGGKWILSDRKSGVVFTE